MRCQGKSSMGIFSQKNLLVFLAAMVFAYWQVLHRRRAAPGRGPRRAAVPATSAVNERWLAGQQSVEDHRPNQ